MKKINKFLSCLGSFLFAGFLGIVGSKVNAHKFKLVFIGDAGVGKTSIIDRYVQDIFNNNVLSTVGADFVQVFMTAPGGEEVELDIYDTAGQEKFRSLTPVYFRGSDAAILVTDMSEPTSLTRQSIGGHIGLLNSQCPDLLTILVVNKSDLVSGQTKYEVVSTLEQNYKEPGQVTEVIHTSAKTGEGIDELFKFVADSLCGRYNNFNFESQTTGRHPHALQITDEIDSTAKKKACCK